MVRDHGLRQAPAHLVQPPDLGEPSGIEGGPTGRMLDAALRELRLYLLAGIFTTGAAVLALELVGSRVISPFYGSSLYSWAAIITVTMVALATGYALGGRAADRDPSPALFSKLVAGAGLAVAVIPLLRVPVLSGTASLGVRLGALASSAILLGPALALLGSLGPVVVRLLTRDVASVGRRAGGHGRIHGRKRAWPWRKGSSSSRTCGSRPSSMTGAPLRPAAAGLWAGKRRAGIACILAAGCAGLLGLRPAPADGMLFSRQSPFGEVRVFDSEGRRFLLVDGVTQSVARPEEKPTFGMLPPFETESPYLHTLELAAAARPLAERALFIGSGAGLLPVAFEVFRLLPSDVVEIDPIMLEAASSSVPHVRRPGWSSRRGERFSWRTAEPSFKGTPNDTTSSSSTPSWGRTRRTISSPRSPSRQPGGRWLQEGSWPPTW